jgi:GTP:adenosylcobinamide-phosphate guanylyltransferase
LSDWRAIILAAGRGPDDPMAKAFGVAHKCTVEIAGKPMWQWVVQALAATRLAKPFVVVIDDSTAIPPHTFLEMIAAENSAPASAIKAVTHLRSFPVLITTADHPLLTREMIEFVLAKSETRNADVLVGLATADVIQHAYPETRRTYFNLGGTRVSGCNLFVVKTGKGQKLLERWQNLERDRKRPWKLVFEFGLRPIFHYVFGTLTPQRAFAYVSEQLGITVEPVFLPYAEAAIDVDKPSDHALAEKILQGRSAPL